MTVDLGIVYEAHPDELSELSSALKDITGVSPSKEKLVGYDGPNEVVQILIDSATWVSTLNIVASLLGGSFAVSFGNEIAKQAAAEVWKQKSNYYEAVKRLSAAPFLKLAKTIKALREKNQTVTVSVKIPNTPRNASLVISSDDPAVIIWQIANITRCAADIREVIAKAAEDSPQSPPCNGDNPDMSIVLELLENGDIKLLGITIK